MTEHRLVRLVGGHSDGVMLGVDPARVRLVEPFDLGERYYREGEWGTESGPPVVTKLIGLELYVRVDADTFQAVAA